MVSVGGVAWRGVAWRGAARRGAARRGMVAKISIVAYCTGVTSGDAAKGASRMEMVNVSSLQRYFIF